MASGGEKPRALVLSADDRTVVVTRLARSVLRFQDDFLSRDSSPAGLLCQVWLPDVVEDNQIVLKTKGMPFCVAGTGDLLALFRCISCRFAFGTTVGRSNTLGAPGRVFTSSEPEMCCNVQQYAKGAYLRKAEAEQCQVQSTLLLPLFISPRRSGCVGVLEVVQTSEDMVFVDVASLLTGALEKNELFTCDMEAVRRRTPATHALLLPAQTGVLAPPQTSEEESGPPRGGGGMGGGGDERLSDGDAGGQQGNGGGGQNGDSEEFSGDDEYGDGDDDDDDFGESRKRGGGTHRGAVQAKPRRKGTGNPGKPGVRLTLADLQGQFGVGLKDAANRLGICPTTLKRACRRHGIQRWPRRQLQKVNRTLDEMEARQTMQPQQHLAAGLQAAGSGGDPCGGNGGLAADNRWTTLAQFIPAYHNQNLLGYNGQQMPPGAMLAFPMPLSGSPQDQHQAAALLMQQHHQAQQQQQQYQQQAQQQQKQQQGGGGGGRGGGTPPASRISLPEGALAMGQGSGQGGGGMPAASMQEVSAISGVSTLGQPPPQSRPQQQQQRQQQVDQQQNQAQQQQQAAAQQAQQAQCRSLEQVVHRLAVDAAQRQASGGGGSGAPRAAEYLQRVAAASQYVSPFGPAAAAGGPQGGAPVVRLPDLMGGAVIGPSGRTLNLSAISVPSLAMDTMPPLGPSPLADDEQVGFLDSTVLELLLNEEQRAGLMRFNAANGGANGGRSNGGGASAGGVGGGLPEASAGEMMPSLAMPGMSGLSGLSFMM